MRGRYLAVVACLDCHTAQAPFGSPRPVDVGKAFQGGHVFTAASVGRTTLPASIYAANLTPDGTGLAGWSAGDIVKALKQGKDRSDGGVCPPMPAGPMAPFGGLSDVDATDLANYFLSLAPAPNAIPNQCIAP